MTRCYNPNRREWHRYGGRGIRVCKRWQNPENFIADLLESYIEHSSTYGGLNTTLDRINVNKNYSSTNCRWATQKEQSRNTRRNVFLEVNGERQLLSDVEASSGVNRQTLLDRLARGIPVNEAVKEKSRSRKHMVTWNGKTQTVTDWAREVEIKPITLFRRLRVGWTVEDALTKPIELRYSHNRANNGTPVQML